MIGALLVVGTSVIFASCSFLSELGAPSTAGPRPFNHEAHLVRGISCTDCHEGAEKEVRAGMPTKAFCMNCHEDLDKDTEKPLDKKVAWFLDPLGEPRWSALGKQSAEIRFSHKAHAGKTACTVCHEGMDKNTGLVTLPLQRMDSCTQCHAREAPAKIDCTTCHSQITRETRPANHFKLWDRMHGFCSREGRAVATANDCALCHRNDSCVTCHQTQRPRDHTEHWRLRGHCTAATADRSRCQTCHTSDSCDRCHRETAPLSHTAGWNQPRNRHCVGCHVPLQSSGGCFVCHKATPGHDTSPNQPPWHNPAMNCRSCHAATLKHPDNGDNCNACHR